MNPIIKWPGGKSREIDKIEHLIPNYKRYVEPFFGGGALFFHLAPRSAAINDISESLIQYYKLIKDQDKQLYDLLMCYNNSFNNIDVYKRQMYGYWELPTYAQCPLLWWNPSAMRSDILSAVPNQSPIPMASRL